MKSKVSVRLAFAIALVAAPATWVAATAPAPALRVERLEIVTSRGAFHFRVEIADTVQSREQGLMFRRSLAPDRGMLFDFKTARPVAFWMKNTLIPLDMLFVGADGRILSIAREATPMSETPIPSGGDALAVIELPGGRAAEIAAEPGDLVRERRVHP
jgi:uncharacterized membrane protein (UPF0127 family)